MNVGGFDGRVSLASLARSLSIHSGKADSPVRVSDASVSNNEVHSSAEKLDGFFDGGSRGFCVGQITFSISDTILVLAEMILDCVFERVAVDIE
jgi:hypothetical protein